jgi:serine/threonine-protein kinase HipA
MHPLISISYQQEQAGIFDLGPSVGGTSRFEWSPSFRKQFASFTDVFSENTTSHFLSFNDRIDLPPAFRDFLPGHFQKALLKEALRGSSQTNTDRTTLAWLALTGDRGFGAFSFEPAGYPELNAVESVDLDRMVRFAAQIQQGKGAELSDRRLRELLRCGLFTRGNSPKVLLAINDFTGEVLSGQADITPGFEGWMVKLDGVVPGSDEKRTREYENFQKAKTCGIQMAPCRILKDGHWKHLMVKRFDRSAGKKIAFVSYKAWSDKEGLSWDSVFRKMRQLRLPYPDMEEMYRRLVFVWKMKIQGYSPSKICLTYSSEGWRLAPAFNLKSSDELMETLSLDNKGTELSETSVLAFGKYLNIRKAKEIITKIGAEVIRGDKA